MLVQPQTKLDVRTLENLTSLHPRARSVAENQLHGLGPKAVEILLRSLEDEEVARRRSRLVRMVQGVGIVLFWLVVILLVGFITQGGAGAPSGDVLGGAESIWHNYFLPMPFSLAYRNAVLALTRYDDVRALPALLKIRQTPKCDIGGDCEIAIMRLSGLVTPAHRSLFSEQEYLAMRQGLAIPSVQIGRAHV